MVWWVRQGSGCGGHGAAGRAPSAITIGGGKVAGASGAEQAVIESSTAAVLAHQDCGRGVLHGSDSLGIGYGAASSMDAALFYELFQY